jgi:uncharacterized phage protein (TIGR02218 family)
MKAVNSVFFSRLQKDGLDLCEMITVTTRTRQFRWVTANAPLVSSGQVYDPFPGGTNGGLEESSDLSVAVVDFFLCKSGELQSLINGSELSMASIAVDQIFVSTPDCGRLEVYRGSIGDFTWNRLQINGQARNLWNGINVKWPYYTYQDQCNWRFGDANCGFNASSVTFTGSIIVGSSTTLNLYAAGGAVANRYSPGGLDRGRVTILSGVNSGVVRTVRTQSGDVMGLSHALPYSVDSGGFSFSVFPGCRKRLVDDCASKYTNTPNFLAFPWMPTQDQVL